MCSLTCHAAHPAEDDLARPEAEERDRRGVRQLVNEHADEQDRNPDQRVLDPARSVVVQDHEEHDQDEETEIDVDGRLADGAEVEHAGRSMTRQCTLRLIEN